MAASKTSRTLRASASLASSTSVPCTELNLSAAYGALLTIKLVNGATAPNAAPVVTVYVGEATTVKRKFYSATGDIVNASTTEINVLIPPQAMFVNVDINNSGNQAITAEAMAQELTSV